MKVFLVEDEYIVREGIKNNIDMEKNGYEFLRRGFGWGTGVSDDQ